jgi:hypothetical protein
MMSFRKSLFWPAVLVAVFAFFGVQGQAVGAPTLVVDKDGNVTAKDVRDLIFKASDASRTRGRIVPKAAKLSQGNLVLRSAPCSKGNRWYIYQALSGKDGGTLCNGERRSRSTRVYGPRYFQWTMRHILDYILVEDDLDDLGPGKVTEIVARGNVATLRFQKFINGKPTRSGKLLTIVGSALKVENYGPGLSGSA